MVVATRDQRRGQGMEESYRRKQQNVAWGALRPSWFYFLQNLFLPGHPHTLAPTMPRPVVPFAVALCGFQPGTPTLLDHNEPLTKRARRWTTSTPSCTVGRQEPGAVRVRDDDEDDDETTDAGHSNWKRSTRMTKRTWKRTTTPTSTAASSVASIWACRTLGSTAARRTVCTGGDMGKWGRHVHTMCVSHRR